MGWLVDILKDVPLTGVLKERVALAEDKYKRAMEENEAYKKRIAALEQETESLRARAPKSDGGLSDDTKRVLVHLFKAPTKEDRDVGTMARQVAMEQGVLKYHLDQLKEHGLADVIGGNYVKGHTYWALSAEGRRHVVEHNLN
jgi:hypothetical protein